MRKMIKALLGNLEILNHKQTLLLLVAGKRIASAHAVHLMKKMVNIKI